MIVVNSDTNFHLGLSMYPKLVFFFYVCTLYMYLDLLKNFILSTLCERSDDNDDTRNAGTYTYAVCVFIKIIKENSWKK